MDHHAYLREEAVAADAALLKKQLGDRVRPIEDIESLGVTGLGHQEHYYKRSIRDFWATEVRSVDCRASAARRDQTGRTKITFQTCCMRSLYKYEGPACCATPDRCLALNQLADPCRCHRLCPALDRLIAKLLYEAIEEIDESQVDAVTATGASSLQ